MAILKQSTAFTRMFLMVQSSDHISALTGASPTVNISKAGGAFAAAGGTVTEVASGFYKVALTTTDTNTLGDLAYHITAASGDATDFVDQVTSVIFGDTLAANLTQVNSHAVTDTTNGVPDVNVKNFNNFAAGSLPANFSSLSIDGGGNVAISANIKKNTAQAGFMFVMTDSTTHAPKTGVTVTATRSIDGAAFASCANAVSEVGSGTYTINLAASDTNGQHIMLRFTGAASDDLNIELITQP